MNEQSKIIALGHYSLAVTLPKAWCLNNNIKKGDLLDVVDNDSFVTVMPLSAESHEDTLHHNEAQGIHEEPTVYTPVEQPQKETVTPKEPESKPIEQVADKHFNYRDLLPE